MITLKGCMALSFHNISSESIAGPYPLPDSVTDYIDNSIKPK